MQMFWACAVSGISRCGHCCPLSTAQPELPLWVTRTGGPGSGGGLGDGARKRRGAGVGHQLGNLGRIVGSSRLRGRLSGANT